MGCARSLLDALDPAIHGHDGALVEIGWSPPAIFLYGESLGWWNAVSLALVVAGAIAFCLIRIRTTGVGTAARRAMAVR